MEVSTKAIYARNSLAQFARRVDAGVEQTMQEMGVVMEDTATARLPVTPKGHGTIAPRLKAGFKLSHGASTVQLESTDSLTLIFEKGTKRRYPIVPHGEAALTNRPEGFGPVLDAQGNPVGVIHPGQRAWGFLEAGFRAAKEQYMAALSRNIPG